MVDKQPIVVMKGITIEFPGVKALDGVDLRLYPGEVHALMGENGAGKSTMIKALTGVYRINAGSIEVEGKPQTFTGTGDAQNAGIATVYQEVNLCTNLSIGENVMLGHEVRGTLGINWKKTYEESKKFLAQMGLDHLDPRAPLSSISIAMQHVNELHTVSMAYPITWFASSVLFIIYFYAADWMHAFDRQAAREKQVQNEA